MLELKIIDFYFAPIKKILQMNIFSSLERYEKPYVKVSDDISGSYSKFTLVLCLIRNVSSILFTDDSIRLCLHALQTCRMWTLAIAVECVCGEIMKLLQ